MSHPVSEFAEEYQERIDTEFPEKSGALHQDEEVLRFLYHEENLSLPKIGDVFDMTPGGANYWMEEHGIEKRSRAAGENRRRTGVRYRTDKRGREKWKTSIYSDGEEQGRVVFVHRLLAVAEFGFEAVAGNVVHHRNHLSWGNWPENLELLTREEHRAHHRYAREFGVIPQRSP